MGWFRLIPRVIQEVRHNSASIYLFKVNNRKTKKMCEICSNLTKKKKKTTERLYWLLFVTQSQNMKNTRTILLTAIRYPVTKHDISLNNERKTINTFSSFFMKPFSLCFFIPWQQCPFTFELINLCFSSLIVCLLGTCSNEFKNPSDQSSKSLFKFPGKKSVKI